MYSTFRFYFVLGTTSIYPLLFTFTENNYTTSHRQKYAHFTRPYRNCFTPDPLARKLLKITIVQINGETWRNSEWRTKKSPYTPRAQGVVTNSIDLAHGIPIDKIEF